MNIASIGVAPTTLPVQPAAGAQPGFGLLLADAAAPAAAAMVQPGNAPAVPQSQPQALLMGQIQQATAVAGETARPEATPPAIPKPATRVAAPMPEAAADPAPAAPAQAGPKVETPPLAQAASQAAPEPVAATQPDAAAEEADLELPGTEIAKTQDAPAPTPAEAPASPPAQTTSLPAPAAAAAPPAAPREVEAAEAEPSRQTDSQVAIAAAAPEDSAPAAQREAPQAASRPLAEARAPAEHAGPAPESAPRIELAARAPAPAQPQPLAPARTEPPAAPSATPEVYSAEPTVEARPGRIGHELGVEVARRVAAGKDELLVRLNPQEMGRIEVRMSFDEGGSLRAVVTADSAAALELLRRDSADLGRTLADAGVRADSDSFRFASRGGDPGAQTAWQGRQDGGEGRRHGHQHHDGRGAWRAEPEGAEPAYRSVRASGQVDLIA